MENTNQTSDRNRTVIRTGIIGIVTNVLLAAFKAAVGILSSSVSVILDAVNNISDAASSVITIAGTKLAGKEADRKHPYGYGRVEYLSALVISVIVLYAGITSLIESVKKIIDPITPDYSTVSLIIIGVAILAKIVLGTYTKKTGEKVKSDSLVNSGKDALLDSIISTTTLIAAFIFIFTGFSVEAYLGALISLVIIKSGIEMVRETISKLLGERAEGELITAVKATVKSFDEVSGAYDLILHNYGPDSYQASVHMEVSDQLTAGQIDILTRKISDAVYKKHNVILTGVGIYAVNSTDKEAVEAREKICGAVCAIEHVIQMHGFYMDKINKVIRFDLVVSFDAKSRKEVSLKAQNAVKELYPDYTVHIALDFDFSET